MKDLFPGEVAAYAEVIVPLYLPRNYTWSVPAHLKTTARPGVRVEVMLGKNRKYAGIIYKLHTNKPAAFEPKPILNVLDEEPLVYPQQLELWHWMAHYYLCTMGEVMQAAIPANLKLSSETILLLNDAFVPDTVELDDSEFLVAEALQIKKQLALGEVQQLLDAHNVYPVIKRLIEKQVCYVWEQLQEKYKHKLETYIALHPQYHAEEQLAALLNDWGRAPRQMELLLAYLHLQKTEGEVTQAALLKKAGASAAQLKGLTEKQILVAEKRSRDRLPSLPSQVHIDFSLTTAQQQAYDALLTAFETRPVCLLHGVTASGKTQLYIRLIATYLAEGKQVLYMLPEIALTAQVVRRLQHHFGGYISVYHSKFNANERVELWNRIKSGQTKIVLGARSALLLPFRNLGLIIVDEEHEPSFKQQEPAPRYHARDAAVYYATLWNARVLMGSATPSVESYQNALAGKYGLVRLEERYNNVALPGIEYIDLRAFVQQKAPKMILSQPLKEAIEQSLEAKRQVIVFQNRRGYAPYLICRVCGWIPHCNNCDVTLTLHKAKHSMNCHYCGTTYPVVHSCAACGSHDLMQRNFGTEKIEELMAETFPDARIARMDYDSVKGKNDHDALIRLFEQHRIDILVGTQMVVKGLDFQNVNLVCIPDGDSLLHFTDFRVNERAYQLMEQVSGRAGRSDGNGRMMVQVTNPYHPVLQHVQQHDYANMYREEMAMRNQFFYPPFSRLILVTFKHRENHIAEEAANLLVQGMHASFHPYITGPAVPVVNRLRNQYLWEVLFKLPKDAALIQQCKQALLQQYALLQNNQRYRGVRLVFDVDPV